MDACVKAPVARTSRRAFSLLEVAIVLVITGVVASVAIMTSGGFVSSSQSAAAKESTRAIQSAIDQRAAEDGVFPTTVDPNWFVSRTIPINPLLPRQRALVEIVSGGTSSHPLVKFASDATTPAFWYNATTGAIRARVPSLTLATSTLSLYNSVNASALASLVSVDGTTGTQVTVVSAGAVDLAPGGGKGGTAVTQSQQNLD